MIKVSKSHIIFYSSQCTGVQHKKDAMCSDLKNPRKVEESLFDMFKRESMHTYSITVYE